MTPLPSSARSRSSQAKTYRQKLFLKDYRERERKNPASGWRRGLLDQDLEVAVPVASGSVVRLRVGLRATFAAPVEALFAVQRLFLPPVPHLLPLPFWERALAAAVLEAALVRPSLKTLLAAVAALRPVCLLFLATAVLHFHKTRAKPFRVDTPWTFGTTRYIPVGCCYIARYEQPQSCTSFPAACRLGSLLALQGYREMSHFSRVLTKQTTTV